MGSACWLTMLGWLVLACGSALAQCEPGAEGASAVDQPASAETKEPTAKRVVGEGALGAQWLFASGKAMPGLVLSGSYRLFRLDLETSLLVLTEPAAEFDTSLLGSQFGFHFMIRPFYGKRWEIAGGLGADLYSLWNLHGDEFQVAFSLRAAGHVWISDRLGAFATARAYPVASSGVELGTARDGSRGIPVLFGAGIEWRFQ